MDNDALAADWPWLGPAIRGATGFPSLSLRAGTAKPTPLSASATPGIHTARTTSPNVVPTFDTGMMGCSGATTPTVANGSSIVASAMAANPKVV